MLLLNFLSLVLSSLVVKCLGIIFFVSLCLGIVNYLKLCIYGFINFGGEKLTIISSNISSVSPDTSLIPLSCMLCHLKLSHSSGMLFIFFQFFFLCFVLQSYCCVFVFIFFSDTINLVQCHFHFKKM